MPGADDTVTIHAYSPPLARTGQYSEGNGDGQLRRLETAAADQLSPRGPQGGPTIG
jgi:hypothetical protein